MLEDIRNQIYNNKTAQDTEITKVESRLTMRIEDAIRNNEKFVSWVFFSFFKH